MSIFKADYCEQRMLLLSYKCLCALTQHSLDDTTVCLQGSWSLTMSKKSSTFITEMIPVREILARTHLFTFQQYNQHLNEFSAHTMLMSREWVGVCYHFGSIMIPNWYHIMFCSLLLIILKMLTKL